MSINHFSPDLQQTLWWSNQQQQKPSNTATTPWDYPQQQHNSWNKSIPYEHRPLGLNLNDCGGAHHEEEEEDKGGEEQQGTNTTRMEDREMQQIDKQHLFEKPLTPSDVGKLNRLVIPKQHAEKYFPLGADAGLLLSFEDEGGKCWRFRYSYWSSSQSYVLTKGWSRYVKDKQLDAGDVILFDRHRINSHRLFIGWRRRGAAVEETANKEGGGGSARVQLQVGGGGVGEAGGGSANWTQGFYSAQYSYPTHHVPSVPDQRIRPSEPESLNLPTGNSRRLRLFGVNLECQMDDSEPSTPEDSSVSSQGLPLFSPSPYPSNFQEQYHQQTDMSLYQDVNHYLHRNIRDGRG